jgi:uncharacterized protein (TIGR02453 family)
MSDKSAFPGFPRACPAFFRELQRNNNRVWFEAHRDEYERVVLDPARAFVVAMGARLERIAPGVQADPRVDRSIFRIFRDTRFSPDKTPYKTNLGLWFWDGDGARTGCSGFYFHVEPGNFFLGVGIYMIPPDLLDPYREAVVDPRHGKTLRRAIRDCLRVPGCEIGGRHYKRVPRGYDPEHPNAELLLHTGLYAGTSMGPPRELYTPRILDLCEERYAALMPLHRWLRAMIARARDERRP